MILEGDPKVRTYVGNTTSAYPSGTKGSPESHAAPKGLSRQVDGDIDKDRFGERGGGRKVGGREQGRRATVSRVVLDGDGL